MSFVEHISAVYNDTTRQGVKFFLAAAGPMSSAYNASVRAAADTLVGGGYNVTLLTYEPTYSPVGCEWHPSVPVHQAMAAYAVPIIARVMGWEPLPNAAPPAPAAAGWSPARSAGGAAVASFYRGGA